MQEECKDVVSKSSKYTKDIGIGTDLQMGKDNLVVLSPVAAAAAAAEVEVPSSWPETLPAWQDSLEKPECWDI